MRGQDVYVSYNHTQTAYVTSSHDGGVTFTEVKINHNAKLGWSLASGGTVTPNGNIYFSWDGYEANGGAKGNVNLYVSSSSDQGATGSRSTVDVSSSPPDCSAFNCGWAFLGSAITLTSDYLRKALSALECRARRQGAPSASTSLPQRRRGHVVC